MSLTDVSGTWPEAWRRDGAQASGNRHSRLSALPGRKRPPERGPGMGGQLPLGVGGTACSDRCVAVADTSRSSSLRRMRANTPSCGSKNSPKSSPPNSARASRSEEHTSELQSLIRISYAVFCLRKKKKIHKVNYIQYKQRL